MEGADVRMVCSRDPFQGNVGAVVGMTVEGCFPLPFSVFFSVTAAAQIAIEQPLTRPFGTSLFDLLTVVDKYMYR